MKNINTNTYNPTFQAYYKSTFSKHLERVLDTNKGKEELVEDFAKVLSKKKNHTNKIGDGSYGEVFKIDDYYVFKTFWHNTPEIGTFSKGNTDRTKALKVYYGDVVAEIGNIQIKRNVTPDKNKFVPMGNFLDDGPKIYEQSLQEFATLPQSAYENLAQDFAQLNTLKEGQNSFVFDTVNSNNFIKVGKSIRIVDDINKTSRENPNDFYSFLEIFLRGNSFHDLKKIILKKCIIAAEKSKLPIEDNYQNASWTINCLFKNAGVNKNFEDYYNKMITLREHCPNDKIRIKLVQDYIKEW